jgi:hypothetical protein
MVTNGKKHHLSGQLGVRGADLLAVPVCQAIVSLASFYHIRIVAEEGCDCRMGAVP